MEITGLGGEGIIAQRAIDYRINNSFDSLDELIDVKGIGEKTLEKIKIQGLACVGNYEESKKEVKNETAPVQVNITETAQEKTSDIPEQINTEPQTIRLTSDATKDIKSGANFENLYKSKILWLAVFGALVGILLAIKKYKEKRNEF